MVVRGTFVWDVLLATAHSSLGLQGLEGLEGWMVGRFGCGAYAGFGGWNQEDRKRVEGCKIPRCHEISLAMSWMLPDELVN